jgi:hypothetical protein
LAVVLVAFMYTMLTITKVLETAVVLPSITHHVVVVVEDHTVRMVVAEALAAAAALELTTALVGVVVVVLLVKVIMVWVLPPHYEAVAVAAKVVLQLDTAVVVEHLG